MISQCSEPSFLGDILFIQKNSCIHTLYKCSLKKDSFSTEDEVTGSKHVQVPHCNSKKVMCKTRNADWNGIWNGIWNEIWNKIWIIE